MSFPILSSLFPFNNFCNLEPAAKIIALLTSLVNFIPHP